MPKSEHGKYIITKPRKDVAIPDWAGNLSQERSTRMFYLDNDVIPGAFYMEVVWFWPTDQKDDSSPDPHSHDCDEVIGFMIVIHRGQTRTI